MGRFAIFVHLAVTRFTPLEGILRRAEARRLHFAAPREGRGRSGLRFMQPGCKEFSGLCNLVANPGFQDLHPDLRILQPGCKEF